MPALDRRWLAAWMRPEHLDRRALALRRRELRAHPRRPIVIERFLRETVADSVSTFLQHEVDTRIVFGLRSRAVSADVSEREWLAAPSDDRFFRFRVISSPRPGCLVSANLLAFLKLRAALSDDRFKRWVEEASAVALGPGEFDAHLMLGGDFLAPHTDAIDGRRLACVLFLTRAWQSRLGGVLRIALPGGRSCAVKPVFNRFAIFDVTTGGEHLVDPIAPGTGTARATISGWFQGQSAPGTPTR